MIAIVYREDKDRWVKGDRYVRPLARKFIRGVPTRVSGMQKVVDNLIKGLNQLGIEYRFNRSLLLSKPPEKIISFGLGMQGLEGVKKNTPVIAAIGFPYPSELPGLCENYSIQKFLQHSDWVLNLVKSAKIYRDDIFDLWSAGIDTAEWHPSKDLIAKEIDVLVYNKIHWDKERTEIELM